MPSDKVTFKSQKYQWKLNICDLKEPLDNKTENALNTKFKGLVKQLFRGPLDYVDEGDVAWSNVWFHERVLREYLSLVRKAPKDSTLEFDAMDNVQMDLFKKIVKDNHDEPSILKEILRVKNFYSNSVKELRQTYCVGGSASRSAKVETVAEQIPPADEVEVDGGHVEEIEAEPIEASSIDFPNAGSTCQSQPQALDNPRIETSVQVSQRPLPPVIVDRCPDKPVIDLVTEDSSCHLFLVDAQFKEGYDEETVLPFFRSFTKKISSGVDNSLPEIYRRLQFEYDLLREWIRLQNSILKYDQILFASISAECRSNFTDIITPGRDLTTIEGELELAKSVHKMDMLAESRAGLPTPPPSDSSSSPIKRLISPPPPPSSATRASQATEHSKESAPVPERRRGLRSRVAVPNATRLRVELKNPTKKLSFRPTKAKKRENKGSEAEQPAVTESQSQVSSASQRDKVEASAPSAPPANVPDQITVNISLSHSPRDDGQVMEECFDFSSLEIGESGTLPIPTALKEMNEVVDPAGSEEVIVIGTMDVDANNSLSADAPVKAELESLPINDVKQPISIAPSASIAQKSPNPSTVSSGATTTVVTAVKPVYVGNAAGSPPNTTNATKDALSSIIGIDQEASTLTMPDATTSDIMQMTVEAPEVSKGKLAEKKNTEGTGASSCAEHMNGLSESRLFRNEFQNLNSKGSQTAEPPLPISIVPATSQQTFEGGEPGQSLTPSVPQAISGSVRISVDKTAATRITSSAPLGEADALPTPPSKQDPKQCAFQTSSVEQNRVGRVDIPGTITSTPVVDDAEYNSATCSSPPAMYPISLTQSPTRTNKRPAPLDMSLPLTLDSPTLPKKRKLHHAAEELAPVGLDSPAHIQQQILPQFSSSIEVAQVYNQTVLKLTAQMERFEEFMRKSEENHQQILLYFMEELRARRLREEKHEQTMEKLKDVFRVGLQTLENA